MADVDHRRLDLEYGHLAVSTSNELGVRAKVTLAVIAGDKTLVEMAQQFEVHPSQITNWKRKLSERAIDVFDKNSAADPPVDFRAMQVKIGQLTLENDFFLRVRSARWGC